MLQYTLKRLLAFIPMIIAISLIAFIISINAPGDPIDRLAKYERPLLCTEYMAREFGSTFEFSLPIFKENNVGCFNWGLVAGKSQTHFGWSTILDLKKKKEAGEFLEDGEAIPEPEIWFHDILRTDGTPYSKDEVNFIKQIISSA